MATVTSVPMSPSDLLSRARRHLLVGDFAPAALLARQAIESRLRSLWHSNTDRPWRKKCPLGRLIDELARLDALTDAEQKQLYLLLTPLNYVIHGHSVFDTEQAGRMITGTERFLADVGCRSEGGAALSTTAIVPTVTGIEEQHREPFVTST